MALRNLLSKFFIVTCNLNQKLITNDYLLELSDNSENKIIKFLKNLRERAPILCVMHKLGHCDEVMTRVIS